MNFKISFEQNVISTVGRNLMKMSLLKEISPYGRNDKKKKLY